MPLGDVQDLVAICKKCEMHDLLNSVNKAVRSFHYYGNHFNENCAVMREETSCPVQNSVSTLFKLITKLIL